MNFSFYGIKNDIEKVKPTECKLKQSFQSVGKRAKVNVLTSFDNLYGVPEHEIIQ